MGVVLMSDVFYDPEDMPAMATTLRGSLAGRGRRHGGMGSEPGAGRRAGLHGRAAGAKLRGDRG